MDSNFILGTMFGLVVGYICNSINQLCNIKSAKKDFRESIKKLTKRASIQDEVDFLQLAIDCSRVSIIRYDRATELAHMDYEACKFGVSEIKDSFQNKKTNILIRSLIELEDKGFTVVNEYSERHTRHLHQAIGVAASYKYKISNTIDDGVLVVAYSKNHELNEYESDKIFQTLKALKLIYGN